MVLLRLHENVHVGLCGCLRHVFLHERFGFARGFQTFRYTKANDSLEGAAPGILDDARAWLEPGSFLDFDHPLFELERFEEPLAREILNALES